MDNSDIQRLVFTPSATADFVAFDNLTVAAAAVPEPQSASLLLLGLVAVAARGITKRSAIWRVCDLTRGSHWLRDRLWAPESRLPCHPSSPLHID